MSTTEVLNCALFEVFVNYMSEYIYEYIYHINKHIRSSYVINMLYISKLYKLS